MFGLCFGGDLSEMAHSRMANKLAQPMAQLSDE